MNGESSGMLVLLRPLEEYLPEGPVPEPAVDPPRQDYTNKWSPGGALIDFLAVDRESDSGEIAGKRADSNPLRIPRRDGSVRVALVPGSAA